MSVPFLVLLYVLLSSPAVESEIIDCKTNWCACTTPGHCQIFCDSATQQCRSAKLRCLPGYPCTIYCLSDSACVDARISGADALHVDVICGGGQSCESGKFWCGIGDCSLQCTEQNDCTNFKAYWTDRAHSWKCNGLCPDSLPAARAATPRPTSTLSNLITPSPTLFVLWTVYAHSVHGMATNTPSLQLSGWFLVVSTNQETHGQTHSHFHYAANHRITHRHTDSLALSAAHICRAHSDATTHSAAHVQTHATTHIDTDCQSHCTANRTV